MNPLVLGVILVTPLLPAQAAPKINSINPSSLQRGISVDVTFIGERLNSVIGIHLAGAEGVKAVLPDPAKQKDPKKLIAKITVPNDASIGDREVRLISLDGVSNASRLTIGILPHLNEKEPNNDPNKAQIVKLPVEIFGAVHAATERDYFKFQAKKGEHLVFEIVAARAGSKLDSSLLLVDAARKELAWSEDVEGFDSRIDYEVQQDGEYLLIVRDFRYRGGADYSYRLRAGKFPFIESIFPMGGQRGQKVEVNFIGQNLGVTSKTQMDLSSDVVGIRDVRAEAEMGPSNARKFDVRDLPELFESEPNNDAKTSTAITAPCVINGRIDKPGDVDTFKFTPAKTRDLNFEVFARRLGSPLDSFLLLNDAAGAKLRENDDRSGPDSYFDFRGLDPKKEYVLSIRDLTDQGGTAFGYRIVVQPPTGGGQQDFAVRIIPDVVQLNRGSYAKVWCDVVRRGGFKGDVELAFTSLPKGVTCEPGIIPGAEKTSGIFTLHAELDAELGSGPITLNATGMIGKKKITRTAVPEMNNKTFRQSFITVLDKPPFTVSPVGYESPESLGALKKEVAAQEKVLNEGTPGLAEAQARWEASFGDISWLVLDIEKPIAAGKAKLTRQLDGSFLASGPSPGNTTYTLKSKTKLKKITAFVIEALPHPSLPNNGPGRAKDGNFVLGEFTVQAAPLGAADKVKPVELHSAVATFSQNSYPVTNAIDGNPGTGWAIHPEERKRQMAIFQTKEPLGGDGGTELTIKLDHKTDHQQFSLGRFRLLATTEKEPILPGSIPSSLAAFLKVSPKNRAAQQKKEWTLLKPESMTARSPAKLTLRKDGAILAGGNNPDKDTFTIVARTDLRGITTILLEALTDPSLSGKGPGRSQHGNFVLSRFTVQSAPANAPGQLQDVELVGAGSDFDQAGFPVKNVLNPDLNKGWAVYPKVGKPRTAAFTTKEPIGFEGGTILTFTLAHQSVHKQHVLGCFRLSVSNKKIAGSSIFHDQLASIIKMPADKRTDAQKKKIAAYYRTISPELDKVRNRIVTLKAEMTPFPPAAVRAKSAMLGFAVDRTSGFGGNIKVTVEGYTAGRDGKTKQPNSIARDIKISAVTLKAGQTHGRIRMQTNPKSETGTRNVVLRAEAQMGKRKIVQYSRAFPVSIDVSGKKYKGKPLAPAKDLPILTRGWDANYYEGNWDFVPDFKTLTPKSTATSNAVDLKLAQKNEYFGLLFTGYFDAPKDGPYTFYTSSDDGSLLHIGKYEVVNNDGLHATKEVGGEIKLKKGKHQITVAFFEKSGFELVSASFKGPGIGKQALTEKFVWRPEKKK